MLADFSLLGDLAGRSPGPFSFSPLFSTSDGGGDESAEEASDGSLWRLVVLEVAFVVSDCVTTGAGSTRGGLTDSTTGGVMIGAGSTRGTLTDSTTSPDVARDAGSVETRVSAAESCLGMVGPACGGCSGGGAVTVVVEVSNGVEGLGLSGVAVLVVLLTAPVDLSPFADLSDDAVDVLLAAAAPLNPSLFALAWFWLPEIPLVEARTVGSGRTVDLGVDVAFGPVGSALSESRSLKTGIGGVSGL